MNSITPIQKIEPLDSLQALKKSTGSMEPQGTQIPFQSMFEDAVNNVKQTQANVDNEVAKLVTGQSDNLHDITIASKKASMSVDLVVQLRNKVMDAYNEIMRMSV